MQVHRSVDVEAAPQRAWDAQSHGSQEQSCQFLQATKGPSLVIVERGMDLQQIVEKGVNYKVFLEDSVAQIQI